MKNFFISSTFTDMHKERDSLHSKVFPRLSQEAFQHGEDAGMRDLRWGVPTSDLSRKEADEYVLTVCLEEIDLCRPYMVVLIGERYGSRFHRKQLEDVIQKIHPASAVKDTFPPLPDNTEELSITEMEILYGALWHPKGTPKPKVIFYIKKLEGDDVPPEYKEIGESEQSSLENLKNLIRNLKNNPGNQDNIIILENTAVWDEHSRSFRYKQDFVSQMTDAILKLLQEEWKNAPHLTEYQRELKQHRSYAQANEEKFFVRSGILHTIYQRLSDYRADFIAIQGEPGSGKTSVMSYLASHPADTSHNILDNHEIAVLPLFCGYTPMTSQATGIMKHMIAFIDEQSAKLLSETSGLKPQSPKEVLPKYIPFEEDDFQEAGFKELLTRLEKSIRTFDRHAQNTGKRIYILIDSIDQLDASTIRDNLLFLPRDLPSTIRIIISCVDQFDLSFWKDRVINMTDLKDDGEIDGILCKQLFSYGKKAEKSLTDAIRQKPYSHNPLYLSLLIQRLNMMVQKDYDAIQRMAAEGHYNPDTAGALYKKQLIEACPDELNAMCRHILNTASEQIGGKTAQLIVRYISASRYGLRQSDLEQIFENQHKEWNSLTFAQFYQYMRSLFIIREDGRYDFSHLSIRDGFMEMSAPFAHMPDTNLDKYLHRVILTHLESLPVSDPLRMNELVYHCLMADDKNCLLKYLCEISYDSKGSEKDKTDESIKTKILRAAAKSIYEICTAAPRTNSVKKTGSKTRETAADTTTANHTDWFCEVLGKCEPFEYPENTAAILRFVYHYLTKTFYDSFYELTVQEQIYTKCLELAEALHHETDNEDSRRILADACYHLGNVYHRQGGTLNYSRALGLYLRESEIADFHKAESLSHLGDIYSDMGGHENQNRALRAYIQSRNQLEQFLVCADQSNQEQAVSIQRLLRRNCQRIGSLQVSNGWEGCEKALVNYERAQEIISKSPLSYKHEQISLHLCTGDLFLHAQYRTDSTHNPLQDYESAERLAGSLRREPPQSDHELIWLVCRERIAYAGTLLEKTKSPKHIFESYRPIFDGLKRLLPDMPDPVQDMRDFSDDPSVSRSTRIKIILAVFYEHAARLALKVHASDDDITDANQLLQKAEIFLERLCRHDASPTYRRNLLSVYEERAELLTELTRRRLTITDTKLPEPLHLPDLEVVSNKNLPNAKSLVYYHAAKKIADLLLKETRTLQSRHDHLTILAKIGGIYSESAETGDMKKAEEYYMLSLEEAISLDKELKSPVSVMDLAFLCGQISHVCKDRHIADTMEKLKQMLHIRVQQLYGIQNFQEYHMNLQSAQISLGNI